MYIPLGHGFVKETCRLNIRYFAAQVAIYWYKSQDNAAHSRRITTNTLDVAVDGVRYPLHY